MVEQHDLAVRGHMLVVRAHEVERRACDDLLMPVSVSLILAYCCSSSCSALRLRALFTIGAYHATVGPLTTVTLDGPSSTSCSSGFRKLRGLHDMMVAVGVRCVPGAFAREERARAAGARCEGERELT